ncbi:GvpL/GvpF family gas vesicle protein [Bacillus sp. USDA818B3_A]|uniref:GvpL/GvpF family gas vesicle protein n=1 Tax=Bacillus sp. USDA818B3_A TaxID=2698834 RepID=UPI001369C4ED|nr:GvpL/GvpF family gas vesicle protein [Bacillus sp. USDA818B3_A]
MTQTKLETNFIYLYGVILTEELQNMAVPAIVGMDQKVVTIKAHNDLTAIVTLVQAVKFNQQQIDFQLKHPEWLKEHAFAHHEVITTLQHRFTILPMSFCTIFQSEENLETLLTEQYEVLLQKLLTLKGNQEWNLKLYCDKDKALAYVVDHNAAVINLRENLAAMPKGKQFLMKKKLEHLITSEMEVEQGKWWEEMTEKLNPAINDSHLRGNWGKEVTERKDEMIVNCDFLVEKSKTETFLKIIDDIEKSVKPLGCSIQVTGPWPPYHFSKMDKVK